MPSKHSYHGDKSRRLSRRSVLGGTLALGAAGVGAGTPAQAYAATPEGRDRSFWLAPDGNDTAAGTRRHPFRTFLRAQQAVREAVREARQEGQGSRGRARDVTVHVRGGTYELTDTLVFTAADGGSGDARVEYRAVDGESPVVSGGRRLRDWRLHDADRGIWRAHAGKDVYARQLWVAGRRAVRARSGSTPQGFEVTQTGYVYSGSEFDFASWRNLRDVEIVSLRRWKSFRIHVDSATPTDDGVRLQMQNPAWKYAYENQLPWGNVTVPNWIENAYELLDSEGEWYLDRSDGFVYYKPRPGEDLRTTEAVLGVLQTLVDIRGTADAPVRNLTLHGLHFRHGTWLDPNTSLGFAALQGGYHFNASGGLDKLPAQVTMSHARGVRVHRCRFEHLGGSGIELESGSQGNTVVGNVFTDVSGNAVQVSGIEDVHKDPADTRLIVSDNLVANNYVTDIASEYHGCIGIFVGYAAATTIEHNVVADVPYTAISVGWGWSHDPTIARDNRINANHVHHFTRNLIDGGGIYTLSLQPGSQIRDNYIHHQLINHYDDTLVYLDEASEGFTVENNVLCSTPKWWLKIWTESIRNNRAVGNYVDREDAVWNNGTDNVVADNVVMIRGAIPRAADRIARTAGLEPAYRDLLPFPGAATPPITEVLDPAYEGIPPLGPPWTP
ncbi:right-handed parallel beta-helix repeat-containing protein [Actinopolymorpha sp. NPDC004070]|uniref:right-handed parallel beta-helix repeat-containing protein n=1 Tax=Actinopolymorpha sp. NPDC004070 TaxID=3154548 RepID=UPI0033A0784B